MKKVWGTSSLPQAALTSSIKPISSSYLVKYRFSSMLNQIVSRLDVINDADERSVQFGSDYNEILTTNEQHAGLLHHQNKPLQKITDFFCF